MPQVAERTDTLTPAFDAFRRDVAFGAGRVGAAREAAFARFLSQGFPTTRHEEWRHTNIQPIAQTEFGRARPADFPRAAAKPFLFAAAIPHRVVLVNGRWSEALSSVGSLPAGVTVRSLRDVFAAPTPAAGGPLDATWPSQTPFVDLNAAFCEDGALIEIAPKTVLAEPLHLVSLSSPGANPAIVCPRFVVAAGELSQAFIVESYAGLPGAAGFTNAVTQIDLAPGAMVDHVKLQREEASTFHLASMFARVDRAATFRSHAVTLGGRIARNDIVATLAGDGAACTLDGLYVADGDTLVDTHTTIDHAMPNCPSHELYKGILAGRARAVFNGKIIVRKDAQKTERQADEQSAAPFGRRAGQLEAAARNLRG